MFTLLFPPIPCVHCQLHSRPIFIGPARARSPAPRNQRSYSEHRSERIGTRGLSIPAVLSSPRRFRCGGRLGGEGERGQFREETSLGPRLPPARPAPPPSPAVYKNKRSSLTPQRSSAGVQNILRVFAILPPEKPTHEARGISLLLHSRPLNQEREARPREKHPSKPLHVIKGPSREPLLPSPHKVGM